MTLEGQDELRAKLAALDQVLRQQLALEAVAAAGKVFVDPLRSAAPDATLRRSIDTVARLDAESGFAISLTGPSWPLGAHALWRERGTKDRYTRDGVYRGRMPATPFVLPTYEQRKGQAQSVLASSLVAGVERSAA